MDLDQDESRMLTAPSEEFHASRSSQESISPAEGVVGEPEPVQEVNTQAAAKSVSFSPRLEAAILSLTAPVTPHEQLEELDRARQAGSVVIAIPAVVLERRFSLPSVRGVGDRRFSVVSALSAASMGKKVCRFCWDGSGELVSSGCQCHDSFLHQECLLRWIESNKRKEKVVCEICLVKHEVVFEPVLQERLEMLLKEKEALEMEDRPPVVRHPRLARVVLVLSICLIIMAVLLVIAYVVVFALSLNPTP